MKSFKEYVEFRETALLLADIDVDPWTFAEWAIENPGEFDEGVVSNIAGWGARQVGNAAGWGARQVGNAALAGGQALGNAALQAGGWGARQAGNAAMATGKWGAQQMGNAARAGGQALGNAAVAGADRTMQGVQNMGNNYAKWRDPVSRVNDASRAIDKVIAAYGDHSVDGGLSVSRILTKMKNTLTNLKQSIETQKAQAGPQPAV